MAGGETATHCCCYCCFRRLRHCCCCCCCLRRLRRCCCYCCCCFRQLRRCCCYCCCLRRLRRCCLQTGTTLCQRIQQSSSMILNNWQQIKGQHAHLLLPKFGFACSKLWPGDSAINAVAMLLEVGRVLTVHQEWQPKGMATHCCCCCFRPCRHCCCYCCCLRRLRHYCYCCCCFRQHLHCCCCCCLHQHLHCCCCCCCLHQHRRCCCYCCCCLRQRRHCCLHRCMALFQRIEDSSSMAKEVARCRSELAKQKWRCSKSQAVQCSLKWTERQL